MWVRKKFGNISECFLLDDENHVRNYVIIFILRSVKVIRYLQNQIPSGENQMSLTFY